VAQARNVHLFTILGAAGIGKSRLAEEFASLTAGEASVVAGRCVPYGEGITFWPLREIVGQLAAAEPLSQILADEDEAELIADRITEAIGLSEASSGLEEIFWAFRTLLETVARDRPLAVVFEDVHWAEPTLLDFIEYLGQRGRDASILLLCLARPELLEERPAWGGGRRNASSLFLEPLSDAESEQLIETLAAGLSETTRVQVQQAAEGNPLFLEQLLAMLAEGTAPAGAVPIPPTIQAVLAARLDRLGPGQRAVIERAAIVGKEFWEGAVTDLLPDDARPFASRHLEALVDKELLSPARSLLPGQKALRFQHVLIQQATYGAIPKHRRAVLHDRVAGWLEQTVGEGTAEYAETAGYHLEQTCRYRAELAPVTGEDRELARRAADLLASASQRAFRRGDMPASANLLGRAVSLFSADDPARLELLPDLSYALFEVGELERANTVLAEAIERGRACGDRGVEWNATVKRGNVRMYTDPEGMDPENLIHDATTAIEVLDDLGDELGLARAWSLLAESAWPGGKMVEAAKAAERAAEYARRAGSRREEAWALGAHSMALLYGPTPAWQGLRRIEGLLSKAAGDVVLEANLARGLAGFLAMSGRFEEARTHIAQSCERLYELGLKWQVGIQELLGGYVELLAEDPAAAERHMRTAKDSFVEIGDRWFLSTVDADLPRPVYQQGRYDEARSLVAAIDEVPAPADSEWQIKRRGIRARLLAREGEIENAERLAREAVATAAATELLWFHADALIDLAEVLKLAGRREKAARAAGDALALYERKGNVASAGSARGLLAALGDAPPRQ
jgi:tetratricopeptide (TPR) repeat protein